MKKKLALPAILLICAVGCQSDEDKTEAHEEQPEGQSYTVTDDRGEDITFEKIPETVVSLAPSNTEILFELGVGENVIGVTEFDFYPEEANEIEKVSDSQTIDAERIIELNPDVVIGYTIGAPDTLDPLEDAGIPVFVIHSAENFDDVYSDIEQIAEVMGVTERGEEIVTNIQAQMEEVATKVAEAEEKDLYFEISPSPDIYTTGANTFQQEIIEAAGLNNVFADEQGWLNIDEEQVIDRNPDLIATTVTYTEDPVGEIKGRAGWGGIAAVENEEVYLLEADIMDRPGPRIGEAVEHLAQIAYPEKFE
ncbi:ABC transporter substrate-binding protein [Shouchella tritolerans]|uniref:ABC transporter substrate-binding protein n=1 Tax=Shouchella tritolerans TaxID=2979466 RepID=UPI000787F0A5|nr:ABC transporter substrate-binding protein [Shouchella tritolerans]